MQRTDFGAMSCPIARGLERVGEWWSMLILRDAFLGLSRFDEFQKSLGIAPNMLARRLAHLVEAGLLEKHRYCQRPPRHEYLLTRRGEDFRPVLLTLLDFGNRHYAPDGCRVQLVDTDTGELLTERFRIPTPDGGSIHAVEKGVGRPLVLLHGVTLRADVWAPQFHQLTDRYRVIAVDLRGHGHSKAGSEGYGIPQLATDLATLLRTLDLTGAIVVGHSMGGMTLMQFCGDHADALAERVAGLVFLATRAHQVLPPYVDRAARRLVAQGQGRLGRSLQGEPIDGGPADLGDLRGSGEQGRTVGVALGPVEREDRGTYLCPVVHPLPQAIGPAAGGLVERIEAPAEEPVAAAAGGADDELAHWRDVYEQFVARKRECNEPTEALTYEKFAVTLQKHKEQLIAKTGARAVRFQVYIKDGKATLKAAPVK